MAIIMNEFLPVSNIGPNKFVFILTRCKMVSYTVTDCPLKILKMQIKMNPYEEHKKYLAVGKFLLINNIYFYYIFRF